MTFLRLCLVVRQKPELKLSQEQICRVCQRPVDVPSEGGSYLIAKESILEDALDGEAIETCPCCGQWINKEYIDRNYRARARRWLKRKET